jgi:hypothetical protein
VCADPGGRAGLLDRGLKSRWDNGSLSLLFVVCCVGSALWNELITHSKESYRARACVCLILCDTETSTMRRIRPELCCCAIEGRNYETAFALLGLPPHLISAKLCRQHLHALCKFSASWINHKIIQRSLPVTEPQGNENFPVARSFRLIQVLEVKTKVIPDHPGCKYFL